MKETLIIIGLLLITMLILTACEEDSVTPVTVKTVPYEERWGIYALDLATEEVELLYSSPDEITGLSLSQDGLRFAFAHVISGISGDGSEICTYEVATASYVRLTDNDYMDVYPCWSPDDSHLAYLSWPANDLDIYVMEASGDNPTLLYDSGGHDADIDWAGNYVAYTQDSQIWILNDDGTEPTQVTDPPNAGQWGNANLPFGDYDPRINPQGTKIVFERLEDDISPHGNYNLYLININGTDEQPLTDTGYSQGTACWSHTGFELVYIVAAIGDQGHYDLWMINSDGQYNRNITPDYFPANFLCHNPVFSLDDTKIYFIGEWWS